MGDITYSAAGIAEIPLLGLQWIGGKRVIVAPKEYATAQTQLFKPWNAR